MTAAWEAVRRLRGARSGEAELLDGPDLDPAELLLNLREMARLNRLPGGTRASIAAIEQLTGDARDVSIVDVGTGSADMPVAFVRHGGRRDRRWTVVAVDVREEILAVARRRVRAVPDVTLRNADARQLPFADRTFDVAHASLLLHHLDPGAAVEALSEMARVARSGVVVNDLQRGAIHYALTAVTVASLTSGRYTRHDGLVSGRRAYTLAERRSLLENAGLRVVWETSRMLPRVVTAAQRPRGATVQ